MVPKDRKAGRLSFADRLFLLPYAIWLVKQWREIWFLVTRHCFSQYWTLPDWLTLPDLKPMKSCLPIRLYRVLVILTVVVELSVRAIASPITEMSHRSMNMETLKVVPPFWRM